MSSFDSPNVLPNVIPRDENDSPVSVQYGYDPTSKTYTPITHESGRQVTTLGPREPQYQMMHNSIASADTNIPTSALGMFNMGKFNYMIVDVKLVGVNSSITLLPLYWNPLTMVYHLGESREFTTSDRAYVDANGCTDIYLLPVEIQGIATVVVAGA